MQAGWRIVWSLAVSETISWGVLYYAFAVVLTPMGRELGAGRAALSAAFSLALLVAAAAAPAVGRWLDRRGPRALMTAGSLLAAAAVAAWAAVESIAALYLVFAAMGLAMATVLYEPAFAVVAQWFGRDLRRALATVTFAAGFASTLFVPATQALVDRLGWRGALLVLAALLAVVPVALHAVVVRQGPLRGAVRAEAERGAADSPTIAPAGWDPAARNSVLRPLALAHGLSYLTSVAVATHLVAALVERGVEAATAAAAMGAVGAAQVAGRVLFAALGRRWSSRGLATAAFGGQALALLALVPSDSVPIAIAAAALFGLANGVVTLLRAARPVEIFGVLAAGSVGGSVGAAARFGGACGPWLGGLARQLAGGYGPLFLGLAALAAGAGLCARRAERRAELRFAHDSTSAPAG